MKEIDNDGTEIILGVKVFNYVSGEEIAFAEAYPVPFKEDIKVSFFTSATTESEISLIDIYSQVHASTSLQPGIYETTMNTQNLPAGIYFVLVRAGNSLKVIKVLKE